MSPGRPAHHQGPAGDRPAVEDRTRPPLGSVDGSLTRLTKPLVQAGLLVERGIVHDPIHGHPTRPPDIVAKDFHIFGAKLTSDWM
jgi:hypothetical protein